MADEKKKATRTVKPVYAVMSIAGHPNITKEDVTIHQVVKNADDLLEIMDSGGLAEGTFYKRIALA
jgi:hypothetical protein